MSQESPEPSPSSLPDPARAAREEIERLATDPGDLPESSYASGDRIGRYKLLQRIGEGGFGTVWMAEQTEPVRRRVALKIIKLGMDSRQVIARFEAERQALALMEHPNIAQVFDGGLTETGRPYFVMELVKGVTITEFCDEARLDLRQRLQLFIKVCGAIQHAHQKGVIHRDVKPSNVLVTLHDGAPVPKVIDFGIAKATSAELTKRTLFTEFGQMVGTPEYMAPEQAARSGLDVDTRADVYSLGILLYELLTGTRPFDLRAALAKGYDELLRTIREEDPIRPSDRVSTLGNSAVTVAESRHVEPRKLSGMLRGDIDWIVLKALEKDRSRRFETASALASDLERHLRNEPVLASPPTTTYKLRKFVLRNRGGVVAASLIVLALIGGVAGTSLGLLRANTAAALASRQSYVVGTRATEMSLDAGNFDEARRRLVNSPAEYRGWEHGYLETRLYAAPQVIGTGLSRDIGEVAWSPDGRRIAAAGYDGQHAVWVWDVDSATTLLELTDPPYGATAVAWSPSGDRLAGGGWGSELFVWDAESGAVIARLGDGSAGVSGVAWSPDGTRIVHAGSDGSPLRVWDPATGEVESELPGHPGEVRSVAWSPDGHRIAAGGDGGVSLWDPASEEHLGRLFYPARSQTLRVGKEGSERPTTDLAERLIGGAARTWALDWAVGGRFLAVGSRDKGIRLWDALDFDLRSILIGHEDTVRAVTFNADMTRLASGGDDGELRLWYPGEAELLSVLDGAHAVVSIDWHPDGRRLAFSRQDGSVSVWEPDRRAVTSLALGKADRMLVAWRPDGREVAAGRDREVQIVDAESGNVVAAFPTPPQLQAVEWSPRGDQIAIASLLELQVTDSRTHDVVASLSGQILIGCVAWSPDGSKLAVGAVSMRPDQEWAASQGLSLSSSGMTDALRIWRPSNGDFITLNCGGPSVRALAFDFEGRRLAAAGTELLEIWDTDEAGHPAVERVLDSHANSVAWSPDGSQLALGDEAGALHLINTRTGRDDRELSGHSGALHRVAWSPDGARVVTSGEDETIRVWDPQSGEALVVLRGSEGPVDSVAWSPDGQRLVSGSGFGGHVRFWESTLATADAMSAANDRRRLVKRRVDQLFDGLVSRDAVLSVLKDRGLYEGELLETALALARFHPEPSAAEQGERAWLVARDKDAGDELFVRAMKRIRIACELEPDELEYERTRGALLYRIGEHAEALSTLNAVYESEDESPRGVAICSAFLGMAHWRLGQHAQARHWRDRMHELTEANVLEELDTLVIEANGLIEGL